MAAFESPNSTAITAGAAAARSSEDISLPDSLPLSQLLECHPEYNPKVNTPSGTKIGILEKCGDLYEGGDRFEQRKAIYLSPREQDAKNQLYKKVRLACASHSEDAPSIIDWQAGNIFTQSPQIESNDEYLQSLNENVDGTGKDFPALALELAESLLVYGRVYAAADFPGGVSSSLQDALNRKIVDGRFATYGAADVDDWACDASGNLLWVRVHTVQALRKGLKQTDVERHCWTYLTPTSRRDYVIDRKTGKDWTTEQKKTKVSGGEVITYDYGGKLPLTRGSVSKAAWLMNRLTAPALNLFNAEAALDFQYFLLCYPTLVLKTEGEIGQRQLTMSELTALSMRVGESAEWIAPNGASFAEYREHVKTKRDRLYAAAQGMPLLSPAQTQNARAPGKSKEIDFAASKTLTSTYRGIIKDTVEYVLDIIVAARGGGIEYEVTGLDEKEEAPDAAAVPVDGETGGALEAGADLGKLPLALQQMALARQRYVDTGDTARAAKLATKMDELVDRI